jgi:FAD/FMN-containing dehydrogenase
MSLEHLRSLVRPDEYIPPSSPLYAVESSTWSLAKQRHPRLVIRPSTVESLASCIKYLASTELHWKVRSQGFGSSSANDVLVSLTAFDQFSFQQEDDQKGIVILGAGQCWGDYYRKMEETAPGWSGEPYTAFLHSGFPNFRGQI